MDCSCMINFIEVPVCAKRTIQTGKSIPSSAEGKKIKHLSKYWGSRRHRTTSAGQILGSRPLQPLRRWRLWDSVTSMHAMMCPCDKTPRTLLSVVNVLTRNSDNFERLFFITDRSQSWAEKITDQNSKSSGMSPKCRAHKRHNSYPTRIYTWRSANERSTSY